MDRWIRIGTTAVVLVVAGVAAGISYGHIDDLARAHGQSAVAAAMLPLSVDGLVVAASFVLLQAARRHAPAPILARFMLGLGVGATIMANVAFGLPYGLLGSLISSWPGIAFVGAAEMALGMVRSARKAADIEITPHDCPLPVVHSVFAKEIAERSVPSIRVIRSAMQCGQSKAQEVQHHLRLAVEK